MKKTIVLLTIYMILAVMLPLPCNAYKRGWQKREETIRLEFFRFGTADLFSLPFSSKLIGIQTALMKKDCDLEGRFLWFPVYFSSAPFVYWTYELIPLKPYLYAGRSTLITNEYLARYKGVYCAPMYIEDDLYIFGAGLELFDPMLLGK